MGLAYLMSLTSLVEKRILIIDKEQKTINDHTWCYWAEKRGPFDTIAFRKWENIEFISSYFHRVISLGNYRYFMVRAESFYSFIYKRLNQFPNIQFLYSPITEITGDAQNAKIVTKHGTFTADWIFDSTFLPQDLIVDEHKYSFLKQHFLGWQVSSEMPIFTPDKVTLFDFCIRQPGDMRFIYILPYDAHHALVEFTLFSHDLLSKKDYREVLSDYLGRKHINYQVDAEEFGVIPMTDQPFIRQPYHRVINIGTKAGLVKPSSGYAFKRIQDYNAGLVNSILVKGQPEPGKERNRRYQFYDRLFLDVLLHDGRQSEKIFSDLFQNNPIGRIFRFLDEEGAIFENLQLLNSLSPGPFLKAFFRKLTKNEE